MDDQNRPTSDPSGASPAPDPDESSIWTDEPVQPAGSARTDDAKASATAVLDTLREAVDDLAERAAPTVREISARAAELTATAAVKAAPLVKRAGEVTADASQKLAEKSRAWAADLRTGSEDTAAGGPIGSAATDTPSDLAAETPFGSSTSDAAPPFESTAESTSEERQDPPVV